MNIDQTLIDLGQFWRERGYQVVLVALALVGLFLAVALVVAWRRKRVDRWVSTVAGFAVLALSAEGMWVVAREKLHLPAILAASVFFVAEATMVSSALQANRHYAQHRHPGKHGRAVWVIATVAGVIVACNSHSLVEFPLRLALPLAAAYLWWNSLTADGTTAPEKSRWRWTPQRFLLMIGAIEPGERDMKTINRERHIAAMTVTAHRLHSGSWPRRVHSARLRRLALAADDDIVTEVHRRVRRVHRIEELTAPGRGRRGTEPSDPPGKATGQKPTAAGDRGSVSDRLSVGGVRSGSSVSDRLVSDGVTDSVSDRSGVSDRRSVSDRSVTDPVSDGVTDSVSDRSSDRPVSDPRRPAQRRPTGDRPARTPRPVTDSEEGDHARRREAREVYRASVAAGSPLSGAALARMYDAPPRWGTRRIDEVRREGATSAVAGDRGSVSDRLSVGGVRSGSSVSDRLVSDAVTDSVSDRSGVSDRRSVSDRSVTDPVSDGATDGVTDSVSDRPVSDPRRPAQRRPTGDR